MCRGSPLVADGDSSSERSIEDGCVFEARGVVIDSPVKERIDAEDTGREVVSGVSSKVSCSRSELSGLDILTS